ncbi:Fe-S protein assembly chaperone HscA [Psychrobacter sanguinis]|uniref:Fe-S protein assembly chaperone HscA n=1 Tax=Psychrobacter sanguinis TaxID=861445 RepID=UPI00020C988B|nr:Fe-S protein assembly chaperone HscA [Psychrobacter sanguinis]EGK10607.1 chaperone HscA [Psychrobacter sp. 1501(2011)]MCC3307345.1 Fe-S protein assembly chaperone HscA [Psychrobacter sanguinis]MCD9152625.1 Fe-S protein assembly chaperone HscA [Psychrobacter sanguinis]MDY3306558.1 Fe-S protein assembly chaperone HscA [Psychrobacter sanguinis]UEC24682.1 Fe-S protein assembly chaperone HscA [Psychrobacter sanguinis]
MSLLQIAEPNQSANPHEHKYALGIDLGTTRSMVAVVRSGKAALLETSLSSNDQTAKDTLLPSVVYYGNTEGVDTPIVGSDALSYFETDPANTIISAKRFMGRSVKDIKFSHPYQLKSSDTNVDAMPSFVTAQGDISPVAVSAEILKTLQKRAQSALPDGSIQGAVITVPAYFDEAQRQATKDAAKLAGLEVLRLLNEPTAAAVAYGLDSKNDDSNKQEHIYLIYDLGGGTFDVSLLKMTEGVFEVLATGGNSALGGDDMDRQIMGWLLTQAGLSPKNLTAQQRTHIARQAEAYKQALTHEDSVEVALDIANTQWQGRLTSEDLVQIVEPITRRTLSTCEQVMRDANIDMSQLDEIIMVGGSTRMPVIQKAVAEFFDKAPLSHLNPDEVVALGAAQVAEQLIKKDKSNNVLLLDVTPLSLGLETMGGLVEVVIPRNTPIPVAKKQTFTTYQDGQTGMVIHVVQGERDTVENCRSLGRFELYGIPPMKAGLARIEVTFDIDANGQLSVSAFEATSGVKSDIKITPSYGLSDEQQEQLLRAGFENAAQDKLARSLIEAKVEAEREILALQSALQEFGSLLTEEEISNLQQAMQSLDEALKQDTAAKQEAELQAIKANVEQQQAKLKPLSDTFAARIMDQSVQQSLAGTSTETWSD